MKVTKDAETFTFPSDAAPLMVLFDKGGYVLKSADFHKDKKEWLYQLRNAAEFSDRAEAVVAVGRSSIELRQLQLPPAPDEEGKREPGDAAGQPGREAEGAVRVPEAAEAADQRDPRAGQRGDVDAVAGVVLQVPQVRQGGLTKVVQGLSLIHI